MSHKTLASATHGLQSCGHELYVGSRKFGNWINKNSWNNVGSNNVLLGKIEGPVWYTIYHQLPCQRGNMVNNPLY